MRINSYIQRQRRHFSNHLVLRRKDGIFLDFPLDMLYNKEDIEKIVIPFAIHEERIERHMKTITPLLTEIVSDAFRQCGYEPSLGVVTSSDRLDLCQFQCNGRFWRSQAV